jgi:NadR type nicotinamide-nucleotide adenylyltransferase
MIQAYQKPLPSGNIGVVIGHFAPLHQGHLGLICRAKKENAGCAVIVCNSANDNRDPRFPFAKRYRKVREYFMNDDLVAVYGIDEEEKGIAEYPLGFDDWLKEVYKIFPNRKLIFYCGVDRNNYAKEFGNRKIPSVIVPRLDNPISGTDCRKNSIRFWDKIASTFRPALSINILIIETASEGKSTLVKDLGKYFGTAYSHEEPRNYMVNNCLSDWELRLQDFMAFLYVQYEHNRQKIRSPENRGVFFADTDSSITLMYAEQYAEESKFAFPHEDLDVLRVASCGYARCSRWDKIFLLKSNGIFFDDNTRYMEHSDMPSRIKLYNRLRHILEMWRMWDKVTELDGGEYAKNFEVIKSWVNSNTGDMGMTKRPDELEVKND